VNHYINQPTKKQLIISGGIVGEEGTEEKRKENIPKIYPPILLCSLLPPYVFQDIVSEGEYQSQRPRTRQKDGNKGIRKLIHCASTQKHEGLRCRSSM